MRHILFLLCIIALYTCFGAAVADCYKLRGESEDICLYNKLISGYIYRNNSVEVDLLVNSENPKKYVYKKSVFKDQVLADEYFYETYERRAALMIIFKQYRIASYAFGLYKKRLDMSAGFKLWDLSPHDLRAQYIPRAELPLLKEGFKEKIVRWACAVKKRI